MVDRQTSVMRAACREYGSWSENVSLELTSLRHREGFPSGSAVKNLPAMQKTWETQVRSLGQEDPLEKETAT